MKVLTLTCPQCGGNLAENSKFCPCCGTPVMVDDSSAKQKITYQQVDDARIREADVHEKIRLKELEIEYLKMQTETQQKKTAQRAKVLVAVLLVMIWAGLIIGSVVIKDEYGNPDSGLAVLSLFMLPVICIVIPLLFRTKK
jgi:uncharacterized membrane protein YvbJ